MHLAGNDDYADCDGEAHDEPVELVDNLEESRVWVEGEDDLQEIDEV